MQPQEHGLSAGPGFIEVIERAPSFLPVCFHHWAKAPCKDSRPVDVISRDQAGIVLIDQDKWIGCRECVSVCPFGAMHVDGKKEVAAKCDLCIREPNKGDAPRAVYSVLLTVFPGAILRAF